MWDFISYWLSLICQCPMVIWWRGSGKKNLIHSLLWAKIIVLNQNAKHFSKEFLWNLRFCPRFSAHWKYFWNVLQFFFFLNSVRIVHIKWLILFQRLCQHFLFVIKFDFRCHSIYASPAGNSSSLIQINWKAAHRWVSWILRSKCIFTAFYEAEKKLSEIVPKSLRTGARNRLERCYHIIWV